MKRFINRAISVSWYVRIASMVAAVGAFAVAPEGTAPLDSSGDLSLEMVTGINRYLARELAASPESRAVRWKRDFSSPSAYRESVAPNRLRLARIVGADNPRALRGMEIISTPEQAAVMGEGVGYNIFAVRWPVFEGVHGEGLMLAPKGDVRAHVVALPDCDWTPEALVGIEDVEGSGRVPLEVQYARRMAESGCLVVVPALIDRRDTYSGHSDARWTNEPHREFIYRAAYEMGTHIIGFEVQKLDALIEYLRDRDNTKKVGVFGYGEGGLVAFYAGAINDRDNIDAVGVSGYFQKREAVWSEPIYRNVWSQLTEFGDAEIATLIAPRPLIIENAKPPAIDGPPQTADRAKTAAPGKIVPPSPESVEREAARARELASGVNDWPVTVISSESGLPGTSNALEAFLKTLGVELAADSKTEPKRLAWPTTSKDRQKSQFAELVEHTQRLMRDAPKRRKEFWAKADPKTVVNWVETSKWYRDNFHKEVIGALPEPTMPMNTRTRVFCDEPKYIGYEVTIDVFPDVYAYGLLLLPKDLKPGERRPVVVCQHGLEGRPQDVADPKIDSPYYHQYGLRLAEKGYVVYAPQNPYIGEDKFRVLQRMANPLKLSLFSFIVRQHQRTIEWLKTQSYVDPKQIAFYGLSYGGKTAVRVPAILEDYCLSICSADYDEWIWKNVSASSPYSYLFTGEYEMVEFDLGNTFNYAEMSWLIFPRPFMVERGHNDGVAPDEWVAYEYARTRRHYDALGLGDRTIIEFFNGPHEIHAVGTFEFLDQHLKLAK
jgi:dienelactone hydrolase